MSHYYILRDKEPVAVEMMEWARWFGDADRHVGETVYEGVLISTIFLGLDHGIGQGGPPLLFETMVFVDAPAWSWAERLDQECQRYCTWDEAALGHAAWVLTVQQRHQALGAKRD